MTIREAQASCGTLSNTSAMPGKSISTPATKCHVGSKLREIPGSVCHNCYACKNMYILPDTKNAMNNRWELVMQSKGNPEPWITGMVKLIWNQKYFRWHDSGDLQGKWHLENIVEVCKRTPHVRHWLPTREYAMIKGVDVPSNLVIRVSAHMVDDPAPIGHRNTSTVVTSNPTCLKPVQAGKCVDCRACWNPMIANISYLEH